MTSLFIVLLTIFLLGICGFVVLLILMQRPSEESGMGATLGGGAVTSVFGGEAVNTLAKATKYCVVIFFTLSLILSLFYMSLEKTIKSQNLLEAKPVAAQNAAVTGVSKSEEAAPIVTESPEYLDLSDNVEGEEEELQDVDINDTIESKVEQSEPSEGDNAAADNQ